MGQVGKFIDHCCEHHPHLMRAVLEQPLAPLRHWIHWDAASGRYCGCLVGTAGLASGFVPRTYDPVENGRAIVDHVSRTTGLKFNYVSHVGFKVGRMARRFSKLWYDNSGDTKVIHMMRQRIARQLAIRESRMLVQTLPNEPSEPSLAQVSIAR